MKEKGKRPFPVTEAPGVVMSVGAQRAVEMIEKVSEEAEQSPSTTENKNTQDDQAG